MKHPSYNSEFRELHEAMTAMVKAVAEMVETAERNLDERAPELFEAVFIKDRDVNDLDIKVENLATRIIMLHNPMSEDLRLVTMAIKIATSLEHIGDLAKNVAKRTVLLKDYKAKRFLENLHVMASEVQSLLHGLASLMHAYDGELARRISDQIQGVDDLQHKVMVELQQVMAKKPEKIEPCTHLLFISRNFERIAHEGGSVLRAITYVHTGAKTIEGFAEVVARA